MSDDAMQKFLREYYSGISYESLRAEALRNPGVQAEFQGIMRDVVNRGEVPWHCDHPNAEFTTAKDYFRCPDCGLAGPLGDVHE